MDCYIQNMGKLIYSEKLRKTLYLRLALRLFEVEFHTDTNSASYDFTFFSEFDMHIVHLFRLSEVSVLNTIYSTIIWL